MYFIFVLFFVGQPDKKNFSNQEIVFLNAKYTLLSTKSEKKLQSNKNNIK